jgi:hypothetical protein
VWNLSTHPTHPLELGWRPRHHYKHAALQPGIYNFRHAAHNLWEMQFLHNALDATMCFGCCEDINGSGDDVWDKPPLWVEKAEHWICSSDVFPTVMSCRLQLPVFSHVMFLQLVQFTHIHVCLMFWVRQRVQRLAQPRSLATAFPPSAHQA